ncbi:MAG: shikimate kinase [Deltaproteobacteria bacterium]|nr:shikimate kinase [Deltaproteobacteria bacterium]
MKIILIGFMGAGKTSVGKELARDLKLPFIDCDQEIVNSLELQSVAEVFDLVGEEGFRQAETEVLAEILKENSLVIACGGGVVSDPKNLDLLQGSKSKIIWLNAGFDTISERLTDDTTRPLWRDKEKAKELFMERQPIYKNLASFEIQVDSLRISEVAAVISDRVKGD